MEQLASDGPAPQAQPQTQDKPFLAGDVAEPEKAADLGTPAAPVQQAQPAAAREQAIMAPVPDKPVQPMSSGVPQAAGGRHAKGSRFMPISTAGFFGMRLLMLVPVIGFVLMVIWACGGCRNANRRNYARATLLWLLCVLVVITIAVFALWAVFGTDFWLAMFNRICGAGC
nr:hypothetical protein [bacterium]